MRGPSPEGIFESPHGNVGRAAGFSSSKTGTLAMLKWALIFFVVSLVAGALGFTGIAGGARKLAQILFGLFLLLAIIVGVVAIAIGQAVF